MFALLTCSFTLKCNAVQVITICMFSFFELAPNFVNLNQFKLLEYGYPAYLLDSLAIRVWLSHLLTHLLQLEYGLTKHVFRRWWSWTHDHVRWRLGKSSTATTTPMSRCILLSSKDCEFLSALCCIVPQPVVGLLRCVEGFEWWD